MTQQIRRIHNAKFKVAVCVNCRTEYRYRGCRCRAKCPKCGEKGTSVKINNKGMVIY